jgi:hypothetical protein
MSLAILLIVLFMGYAADRWSSGLPIVALVAVAMTMLCLLTTNNPSFTGIERELRFTLESLSLNLLVKLALVLTAYSGGYALKLARQRWRIRSNSDRGSLGNSSLAE